MLCARQEVPSYSRITVTGCRMLGLLEEMLNVRVEAYIILMGTSINCFLGKQSIFHIWLRIILIKMLSFYPKNMVIYYHLKRI